MPHHDFGIMQTHPQNGKQYDKYEPEKYNCISVNDDHMEDIIEKLNDIDFYWHTIDSQNKGLAYYGITLIPPSSMEKFVAVIEKIPELYELKQFLSKAHKENKWIIHFGI